jgi:hypothetical protein
VKQITDKDIERAERAVDNLTAEQRRRRDRWARWFERSMLLVLAILYLLGFHAEQQNADAIKANRIHSSGEVCATLNRNAAASNRNTRYIAGLILMGAKQSKPFEPLYRRFGFPAYEVRYRQAQESARKLTALQVPILDCKRLITQVRETG